MAPQKADFCRDRIQVLFVAVEPVTRAEGSHELIERPLGTALLEGPIHPLLNLEKHLRIIAIPAKANFPPELDSLDFLPKKRKPGGITIQ